MEYTRLGRSGLKVSRLCLGTMNFGLKTEQSDAHDIMDEAHELGINYFDTANVYGSRGGTEEIIGHWFAGGNGRRERTVLATKAYMTMGEWPNQSGLSALAIRRECDASLRRLRTDYVDIFQMHHIDRATPWDEIWEAMETLRTQGKAVYFGSSNFAAWHIAQAQERATARGMLGLVSEQSLYNLVHRTVELEVLPAAQHYGLGLVPWSPLEGGLLAGILTSANEHQRRKEDRSATGAITYRDQIVAWEKFCADRGEAPALVALGWLLHQIGVSAPIIGPRTLRQLRDTVPALSVSLDGDALRQLDAIFPGPGGSAPEAYAW
jgi:aryl-alcohol dehydrogenase-like predicted oxidoreductase